jgi:hypothetical protein
VKLEKKEVCQWAESVLCSRRRRQGKNANLRGWLVGPDVYLSGEKLRVLS